MQVVKFIVGVAVFAAAYAASHRTFNKEWPDAATVVQVVFAFAIGGALNPLGGA
jgi:hypothetical protein